MPTICLFEGIVIRMYPESHTKHKEPHLHAEYQGEAAIFDLEGNKLEGSIPSKKEKLVVAWIALHQEDLMAN